MALPNERVTEEARFRSALLVSKGAITLNFLSRVSSIEFRSRVVVDAGMYILLTCAKLVLLVAADQAILPGVPASWYPSQGDARVHSASHSSCRALSLTGQQDSQPILLAAST